MTKTNKESRAKYQCPPELKKLIDLTNLVPMGINTPYYESEVVMEIDRLKAETNDPAPPFSEYAFIVERISFLPAEFLEYLNREAYCRAFPFGIDDFTGKERAFRQEFIGLYVNYCSMRDSMLWLVLRLESERARMRDIEKEHDLEEDSLTFEHYTSLDWDAFPISIKTTLIRDDNGKLKITGLASLIGKFDDTRLRKCKICNKIFWAKRKEAETCSRQCANTLRVRRHRLASDKNKQ